MEVQRAELHVPPLDEVAKVLQDGLSKNFASVQVNVVDCPDLRQAPFTLAAPGLCGSPRVADIGGVPNLIPLVDRTKRYNLEDVAKKVDLPYGGFVCGAGAGPFYEEGVNCEMMANLKVAPSGVDNQTHISRVNTEDGSCDLHRATSTNFALLGNMFCSEGKSGKVLEVKASRRTGAENYMTCIRKTLLGHYGEKAVAMGGSFLIDNGKAHIHIMPDFSCTPLNEDADVDKWLKFYEFRSPLVAVGYLISADPADLDLRVEHFHCFSHHGEGGHYHYDTTPESVQYTGYFNVAESIYRIDRPKVTHNIGRD